MFLFLLKLIVKVKQVANVSAPEPRLITIVPWERTMLKEIEKAIDQIILNNVDSYNHRWSIENFLLDILEQCPPNNYVQFLNALVEVNDNLLDFHSFENAIEKAINEWDYYPYNRQNQKCKI